jgi:putative ABC transport system permease protein
MLRKNPGFTAIAIITLALGIGASTAIFSVVNPTLFASLPYPNPERLVMVYERSNDGVQNQPNFADYVGLTERSHSFEAVAAMKSWQPTITGNDEPERLEGQRVSAPFLRVLGIGPMIGRDFETADDLHRGPNVVILSHKLWRRRFAADPAILGRQIKLDDEAFVVVGVMPEKFDNVLAPAAELWAPIQYDRSLPPLSREWGHHLQIAGRLKSNIRPVQADSEVDVIARTLAQLYSSGYKEAGGPPAGFLINTMQQDLTASVRPALLAVFGAVILLLLIAAVNVTNLLLARGAQRKGEFAMRAALGAGRARLVRQLLTESVLLSSLSGVVALMVAQFGVRALVALSPPELPRVSAIEVDSAAFAFAFGVTTLVGLAIGLLPALHASRGEVRVGLQQSGGRTVGGHQFARRTLVVAEVAVALVLLVSAGLLLRSLQRLFSVDMGFDSSHLITLRVQESGQRYLHDDARVRFFQQALERAREVPGVEAAGFTSQLPLSSDNDVYGAVFAQDLQTDPNPSSDKYAFFRYAVTPGYLEAMRIPLLRGRLLNESDNSSALRFCFSGERCGAAPSAVLISESFARRVFSERDPLGERVRLGPATVASDAPWATIVGVVGDVRQLSLADTGAEAIYVPNSQWFWGDMEMTLVVRARGDATALVPALRAAIWSVDKDQPIVSVATMEKLVQQSAAQRRFAFIIFEAFALAALVLSAAGIYGVLSGGVTERLRELAVRAALGASRADLAGMILRQGMLLTGLGIVIGLTIAFAASQALVTLLFGISRLDPVTYLGVITLIAIVSAIACYIPARRATKVDPMIALRCE